ncbi:Imidazoleglycerol-phosphate dehydratase, partial [Geodia barretti]
SPSGSRGPRSHAEPYHRRDGHSSFDQPRRRGRLRSDTGNGFLDHMVSQISRHGLIDITLKAEGDLHTGWHHLVEDVGITLGRALNEAIGDARGIRRMGHAIVPLDETLAMVALDCSGRGYAVIETTIDDSMVETLPGSLVRHFFESIALEGKINLHAKILTGIDPHHTPTLQSLLAPSSLPIQTLAPTADPKPKTHKQQHTPHTPPKTPPPTPTPQTRPLPTHNTQHTKPTPTPPTPPNPPQNHNQPKNPKTKQKTNTQTKPPPPQTTHTPTPKNNQGHLTAS